MQEARLERKYEHSQFSSQEMAFLTRHFALHPLSPLANSVPSYQRIHPSRKKLDIRLLQKSVAFVIKIDVYAIDPRLLGSAHEALGERGEEEGRRYVEKMVRVRGKAYKRNILVLSKAFVLHPLENIERSD